MQQQFEIIGVEARESQSTVLNLLFLISKKKIRKKIGLISYWRTLSSL